MDNAYILMANHVLFTSVLSEGGEELNVVVHSRYGRQDRGADWGKVLSPKVPSCQDKLAGL